MLQVVQGEEGQGGEENCAEDVREGGDINSGLDSIAVSLFTIREQGDGNAIYSGSAPQNCAFEIYKLS